MAEQQENEDIVKLHDEEDADPDIALHANIIDSYLTALRGSALKHVEEIKSRIIQEKDSQLSVQKEFYEEKIKTLSSNLDNVTTNYEVSKSQHTKEIEEVYLGLDNYSAMFHKKYCLYISPFSAKECLNAWKIATLQQKKYKQLEDMTRTLSDKRRVARIFHSMHKSCMRSAFSRLENDMNAQVGQLAKQTIEAYELELARLRQEVVDAHAIARHEQIRRHQLEEDLRRMFLKNMTAMNMEALSLFNFPPEYKPESGRDAVPRVNDQVKKDLLVFVQGDEEPPAPRNTALPVPQTAPEK